MALKKLLIPSMALLLCLSCITVTNVTAENTRPGIIRPIDTDLFYEQDSLILPDVDIKKGRWLLHDIDVPARFHNDLYTMARTDFKWLLGNRLDESATKKDIILPQIIPLHATATQIKELATGTADAYDYLINFRTFIIAEDRSVPGIIGLRNNNSARIILEIYDLKKGELYYSHYVTTYDDVDQTINFDSRAGNLLLEGYKVIINKLKDNVVK